MQMQHLAIAMKQQVSKGSRGREQGQVHGNVMLRPKQCERSFGFGMEERAWRASVRGDKKGWSRRDLFHRRLAIASVLPHRAVDE